MVKKNSKPKKASAAKAAMPAAKHAVVSPDEKQIAEDKSTSDKPLQSDKPPLIFLPGSSGKVGKDTEPLLERLRGRFDVYILGPAEGQGGLWATGEVQHERNVNAALGLIRSVVDLDHPWYCMASSFGIRVAAELLGGQPRDDKEFTSQLYEEAKSQKFMTKLAMGAFGKYLTPLELPTRCVALGIPLYADSKTKPANERVKHFRESFPKLSKTKDNNLAPFRVLLCSGTGDPCINGKAPKVGPKGKALPKGEALLEAEADTWACAANTEVYMVQGGYHGVFDGSAKPAEINAAFEAIEAFLCTP